MEENNILNEVTTNEETRFNDEFAPAPVQMLDPKMSKGEVALIGAAAISMAYAGYSLGKLAFKGVKKLAGSVIAKKAVAENKETSNETKVEASVNNEKVEAVVEEPKKTKK